MKKPKYVQTLWKLIFECLAFAFLLCGVLSFLGVMKPSTNSKIQDPILMGEIFAGIGISSAFLAILFHIYVQIKVKRNENVLSYGDKYVGTVEKVYLQKYTKYVGKSPYRICFSYYYKDKKYHKKSEYLWEKPNVLAGDKIEVLVDELNHAVLCMK